MLRSETGLLATVARIINLRVLIRFGGGRCGKKIEKTISDLSLALRIREYIDIARKIFPLGSSRYHNKRRNGGGNYICS